LRGKDWNTFFWLWIKKRSKLNFVMYVNIRLETFILF